MAMNLSQIKEALAKVEDSLVIYKALTEVEGVLNLAGNLEATRISLEPKVGLLKEEISGLEERKADIGKDWDLANSDLADARAENETIVAAELEAAREKAESEVQEYKKGLLNDIADLSMRKETLESEVKDLSGTKSSLESDLNKKIAELDVAKKTLEETTAKVALLKGQLASIAGKL